MKNFLLPVILGVSLLSCTHQATEAEDKTGDSEVSQSQTVQDTQSQNSMAGRSMGDMTLSPELRRSMAAMHQEVAQCLRSGRSQQDCMQIMRTFRQQSCEKMGKDDCMMLGRMMGSYSEEPAEENQPERR